MQVNQNYCIGCIRISLAFTAREDRAAAPEYPLFSIRAEEYVPETDQADNTMGWAAFVAAHGYIAVAGILLISALGLPAPVSLALMLGGAAAHGGSLRLAYLLPLCIFAENLGATILYIGGRKTGWWLLGRLCRVTMDPENCIFRSADFFYERGPHVLLFARFIPGLNSMGPPLAGT